MVHKAEYTNRWFKQNAMRCFREVLLPRYADGRTRHPIRYLEIGVYEGMSMVWMLDNVLTHYNDVAIGVDPFLPTDSATHPMEEVERRCRANLARFGTRVTLIKSQSWAALRSDDRLAERMFDVIFIDGDHSLDAVKDDVEQCWAKLMVRGILICDDYMRLPRRDRSRTLMKTDAASGIDAALIGKQFDVLFNARQLAVKRIT